MTLNEKALAFAKRHRISLEYLHGNQSPDDHVDALKTFFGWRIGTGDYNEKKEGKYLQKLWSKIEA